MKTDFFGRVLFMPRGKKGCQVQRNTEIIAGEKDAVFPEKQDLGPDMKIMPVDVVHGQVYFQLTKNRGKVQGDLRGFKAGPCAGTDIPERLRKPFPPAGGK